MNRSANLPIFLGPTQLARELGVSTRTLRDLVARGVLPAPLKLTKKTIRWPRQIFESLMLNHQGLEVIAATQGQTESVARQTWQRLESIPPKPETACSGSGVDGQPSSAVAGGEVTK